MNADLERTLSLEQAITGERMRQIQLGIMMVEVELMRLRVLGFETQELKARQLPEYVLGQPTFSRD